MANPTRRSLLQGGLALAGAVAIGSPKRGDARAASERPTLVVLWLNGGPAGLFNSADSFLATGAFGVTHDNVRALGNDLFVDAGSLGALPAAARAHMASVSFSHGILRPHEHARAAVLESGGRSQLLRMAAAMPASGAIRCALVMGLGLPKGVSAGPPSEAGASLDFVMALPSIPGVDEVRAVYGVASDSVWIRDQACTFAAVEGLVRAGAGLIFAQPAYTGQPDKQFDTHGDTNGEGARKIMAPITPMLATFLDRVMGLPGRNVVTMLVGEWSRSHPDSDHEPGGTATVIGKYVKTGTTGPQRADGHPPANATPPDGLWAYAAAALRVPGAPFGKNPNPQLLVSG